jgi:hypothetical protein
VSARLGTEKLSPFQLGLHHFNPPPKASSYKSDNEVLHQRGKILGDEQCVQTVKDKGMQTQCEVKIYPKYFCSQKLNSLLFHGLDMAHLYPSNGIEGPSQNVSSTWKVKIMDLMT